MFPSPSPSRMTAQNEDELMHALAAELNEMTAESAERLTRILRGLFACMQDLNERVAALESSCGASNSRES